MSTHTIRYVTCDVFTRQRFGGNPLAVVPDARGLSDARMQQIAAEFGYSETTFVLPPEASGDRRVRIFTPKAEMPFAGHPNLGTAFVLDALGELGAPGTTSTVTFEEEAGLVPIRLSRDDAGRPWLELAAPGPLEVGRALPPAEVAGALGLSPDEVRDDTHPPCAASVGLPFWMVELRSRDALARARVDPARLEALGGPGDPTCLHVYLRSGDEADLRARMFAPLDGVAEDPATGSANAALAGLLARCEPAADGDFAWSIAQGVEMGRPSRLRARAGKRDGEVVGTWVGGSCVRVCTGEMEVG